MMGRTSQPEDARVVYCNCTYAKVVPEDVKTEVLTRLSQSGAAFDAVADLCEMSARKDPALERIAAAGPVRIIACYPRAVHGLFRAAQAPLAGEQVEIFNMRVAAAVDIVRKALPVAVPVKGKA
ncbi:MAG: hypothetical protein O7F11_02610 [Acidobacteria bacterium]|nr:hypothetical protein [Acidobacteriota bacterium]MCZ6649588.1 hypothetical protein [Acidobacteriota bacterium]MCZ6746351.1 hypothetical protein [Acidobacteriota bacterium]MCZ6832616.1 hypothetical protein [Acidobacteriota bacterium]